jgi:hypothetical protein
MKTFRGMNFYADNARNLRIATSETGDVDTSTNAVSAPTDQIVSYDDFPRNGRLLLRVPVVPNQLASSTEVYIPNITFWRTGGDPNMDRAIIKPLGALSMGDAKLALVRTYNYQDLLCTDGLAVTIATDTVTCAGHTFVNDQLVYFTTGVGYTTEIYTVMNASGSTCKLRASGSNAVVASYSISAGTIRIFNTVARSLRVCSINASTINSGHITAISGTNHVAVILGDSLKSILPGSSGLDTATFGSGDLVNIQENKRYKVVNYVDNVATTSSPNQDTFQLANLESSTARSFSLGSAKVCIVANLGTTIVSNDVKIRHTQRLSDNFPLGGEKQLDPNQIVVRTGSGRALPRFVWFLIDIIDILDGDYRYTVEYNPSLEEMLYTIDPRTPNGGGITTGGGVG